MNNLGIVPMGLRGQQLVSDSLCIQGFDPGLSLLAPINPMIAGISLVPPPPGPPEMPIIKEIIHCQSCTLFPQNPNLPPPSTRERPPGCKTVFVGGLPENASEEIIREVFDQCGEIIAIRKSKKNFCHIRFSEEFMVDKSLYLSGYRMRIGSSTDKKDSGRMHVDFAQARDDLYEWECQQRLLAREERHRRKIHEDFLRPPSPPPIMHFSEHEAGQLAERLKDDHKFSEATAVLFTWIDRGEVNRRSANNFYSMIQSANSHVRRLMSEKAQHEEEMELAKETFKNALLAILTQFEQITAVFTAASRQKAWDHFSKAQRKNIDIWRKQCEELRNAHSEEIMGIRREEEMEMSDDDSDESPCKKIRVCGQSGASLREENDSLRWQLDAYRNEVELLRKEQGKACRPDDPEHFPDTHTHLLQQSMHNMQQVHTHTCYSRACTTCNRYTHTPATAEHAQHATGTHTHTHTCYSRACTTCNRYTHTHTCYSRACTTCNRYTHTPATAEHAQHATGTHTHTCYSRACTTCNRYTHTHLLQQSMHNMQQVHTHTCYSRACTTCNRYTHTPARATCTTCNR
uniref:Ecto-NOX disulfide-thiol exchanger 1 n=1 Tax=Oncorhynchus kisutch TaxID=8019 RepID=A0A8C7GN57_ONCKI